MDSERHALAKRLFGDVCDLPESERSARLRTLTDDAEIIAYVELLLRQTDTDHPRVAEPVLRMMSAVAGDDVKVGDTLGAWRLVGEIGQGGMGTVFRAQRSDGHFEQEAAVKLLHGIPSAKSLAYLARERQILATLTHPNIARLYDGGTTPHGQPFLVMEAVDGVAIDRYVRDSRLTVQGILKLMIEVCGAISFAHQRLIVHCDIKPSNILVTPSGRPVLLDFGIARLLDHETRNEPVPHEAVTGASSRQTIARAFTPQYASPEQRNGEALTTATDVYSLGRLLDELLHSDARMDGELRAIAAKAAEDDPAKRYVTAAALAADMKRYLQHEPVRARPATPLYVASKFTQRHWPWLAVAGIVALTAGVAAHRIINERDRAQLAEQTALRERDTTRLARAEAVRERDGAQAAHEDAERERERAIQAERLVASQRDRAAVAENTAVAERDRARLAEIAAVAEKNRAALAETSARQTSEFLVSVFDSTNPNAESGDIPASKLLAAAESRLERDLKGQPGTQAELYSALGRVQDNMGANAKALSNYERAIELERTQNRPLVLAGMLMRHGVALRDLDSSKAEMLSREALALHEKYSPPDSSDLGEALTQLGHLLSEEGKRAEGAPYLRRGLAINEQADANSDDTANSYYSLGLHLERMKDYAGGETALRRALAIRLPRNGPNHPQVLIIQERLAVVLTFLRRYTEAEALLRHNVAAREKLHGRENGKVADQLSQLARTLMSAGRSLDSLPVYKEALAIIEKTSGRDTTAYIVTLNNYGIALFQLADYVGALPALMEAQAFARKNFGATSDALATSTRSVGRALTWLGRHDEARSQLSESYELSCKTRGENSSEAADSLIALINLALESNNVDEAVSRFKLLEPLLPRISALDAASVARLRAQLADRQGKWEDALRGYDTAEKLMSKSAGEKSTSAAIVKMYRADLLSRRGTPLERAAGAALAREIISQLTGRVAPQSVILGRLQLIAAQK